MQSQPRLTKDAKKNKNKSPCLTLIKKTSAMCKSWMFRHRDRVHEELTVAVKVHSFQMHHHVSSPLKIRYVPFDLSHKDIFWCMNVWICTEPLWAKCTTQLAVVRPWLRHLCHIEVIWCELPWKVEWVAHSLVCSLAQQVQTVNKAKWVTDVLKFKSITVAEKSTGVTLLSQREKAFTIVLCRMQPQRQSRA